MNLGYNKLRKIVDSFYINKPIEYITCVLVSQKLWKMLNTNNDNTPFFIKNTRILLDEMLDENIILTIDNNFKIKKYQIKWE